jgi:hypothetical protein
MEIMKEDPRGKTTDPLKKQTDGIYVYNNIPRD